MARIDWTRTAIKDLLKLPPKAQVAITDKLDELAAEPGPANLDVRKLTDRGDEHRLRVGNYRVIYKVVNGKPKILQILRVLRRTSQTY